MAKGVKTGGRKKGTENKVTQDLRLLLKDLLTKELTGIGKHLSLVEPKDRLDLIVKLLPYALPKYEQVTSEDTLKNEPIGSFMNKMNESLKQKGYGH